MGYGDGVKGYRAWSQSENRVILSRNVVFDEASIVRHDPGLSTQLDTNAYLLISLLV